MDCITTRFGEVIWSVREPIVTRYLEREFVDQFFHDGTLMLPSLRKLRRNPDEERGDPGEGHLSLQISAANGTWAIAAMNGQENYVLSTCAVENPSMSTSFPTTDGFRILEPLRFAHFVSGHIPDFVGGIQGLCNYRDSNMLWKRSSRETKPPEPGKEEEWSSDVDRFVAEQTQDLLFLKLLRFAHQIEYRFIWFAGGKEREDILIKVPEARAVCEPLHVVMSIEEEHLRRRNSRAPARPS